LQDSKGPFGTPRHWNGRQLWYWVKKQVERSCAVTGHINVRSLLLGSKLVVFREVFVYKGEESVTDIGVDLFAERRTVPEDIITLPVFPFSSPVWLLVQCSARAFVEGFLVCVMAWSNDALSDNRNDSSLLMPAGVFFVVIGGWLLPRWTNCSVVLGFAKGLLVLGHHYTKIPPSFCEKSVTIISLEKKCV